ncbi:MAG: AI-2E family transporter [Microbacteriaceae bacterium]|nr:AI-2E family transporter [Microbacteriaceae bacterium]
MFAKSRALEPTPAAAVQSRIWSDSLGHAATRCAQALLVLIVVVVSVYAIIQLKLVVIPVILALILASAVRPLVRFLERRMPRVAAAAIALLLGVIVFGGIITIAIVGIQSQFGALKKSVSTGIDQVVAFVNDGPIPINAKQISDARKSVLDFVTSSQFGTGALAGVSTAIELITGIVLAIFVLFYFTKDGPQIWSFLIRPLKPEAHAKARRAGDCAVSVLGGYVRGTAIVAFVDAAFIGVALLILKVPLALPLSILVFIGAFIPIVGASATGIIAGLVALVTVDLNAAIWIGIVVIAVNQLEGNFLSPVVLGKSLKLHELVVLLALTAGTILGGIVGTLLSVPIAAVAWAIIKSWNEPAEVVPGIDAPRGGREKFVVRR